MIHEIARFSGRSPLPPDTRSWYQGARGENEVARLLFKNGSERTVLSALLVGSADSEIDHLMVVRTDLFTIKTSASDAYLHSPMKAR
jgi:hypothetical protein